MSNEKQTAAALVAELRRGGAGVVLSNVVYDTAGAAALLHRSPRWVARMCGAGRIASVKCGGWLMTGAALLAFIQGGAGQHE